MPRMSSKWSVVSGIVVLVVGALRVLAASVEAQIPKSGTAPTPEVRQALAPTGTLRVGLVLGNPVSIIRDSASGEMKGVGFDLGQALAQRMGVPFELVLSPLVGALLDGAKSGAWDVTFMAVNPAREKDMDFTAPYLEVEFGYLILDGSALATLADVDRPGIRVAVVEGGPVDIWLSHAFTNAVVVRGGSAFPGALELLQSGRADVLASSKPILFETLIQLPGSRVLDGRLASDQHALGMPKRRDLGTAYARQFVEDAKSEGLVKAAVERAGVRGAVVAPLQ